MKQEAFEAWFAERGWEPFDFQREIWAAMAEGESGLLHAPTGMGKTLAVWLGGLARLSRQPQTKGLQLLWVTPLRALAGDTAQALQEPLAHLAPHVDVQIRTGDTSSHVKQRQEKKPPAALVTTPESLTLLLTRKEVAKTFSPLTVVIVDEWHELLGSKRGVQTELALARLKKLSPGLSVWGLSATMGNLEQALDHLLGFDGRGARRPGRLVHGAVPKDVVIDALLPESTDHFPWAGHLGLKMLPQVLAELETAASALVFTNTRSQTELWHSALIEARPDWAVGLHHGSLSQDERLAVEKGLKAGTLKVVVCTSSLDLGVDFSPVERVLQVGSPKGVARLLQRAGRSGHSPGRPSRVTCVPSSVLELVEAAAARDAASAGQMENRQPFDRPLDLLAQHVVSMALGGGFAPDDLLAEVRTAASYRDLSQADWDWVLDFLTTGGKTLTAYPQYRKLVVKDGQCMVQDQTIAKRHRMSLGTIVSDAAIQVSFVRGPALGTVEESFISRLSPGDRFLFAGRALELVRVHNMTATVRRSKATGAVPVWYGGRMPLSSRLARAVRTRLNAAASGEFQGPEMEAVRPVLELQADWSRIPRLGEVLLERISSREGHHTCLYPFAGRLVHEGLAALLAMRMARIEPLTFTWTVNDYGLELLSAKPPPLETALERGLFDSGNLTGDILESLNAAELARSRFREIARIAGLVFEGYPGKGKTVRQIQATSSLLYDVFARYDPDNELFKQASREVLERQLEATRLGRTLERLGASRLVMTRPERVTPLAFPLLVDRWREKLSTEKLQDRIYRMVQSLENKAARA
jgi:ATP-dependent Lhr-like helicase